ncbi:(-)-alpha-terpineol synthase-like [Lotus japonicus]|uniref:(-)-alpha-terpineol synthase-like n=1 Tax=Lotus japonicus TaxID=34305 RepID=UPI0025848071|nr:(-)-alpha-terpineol synthase-like [Lotus japonicus]
MTRIISFITLIDDVYDVYGTLEELERFTEVIDRCDLSSMDSLPDYMKTCFQAPYNLVNEMASEYPEKNGYNINITSYLMKAWANLCKAFLNEAKWYHSGYTPSFEEYIQNGVTSSSVPLLLTHTYFLIPNSFKEEEIKNLEEYPDIICFAGKIFRMREDATGDVAKSLQCYMNQSGAPEAEAREHLTSVIHKTWKKFNEATHNSSFSQGFKNTVRTFVNVAIWSYQRGDGYTIHDPEIQSLIRSLMVQPILP